MNLEFEQINMEGINIAMEELKKSLLDLKDADEKLNLKYPFDTKKNVYDPDSSLRAWEYYFKMYYEFLSNVEKENKEDKNLLFEKKFGKKNKFWLSGKAYKRIAGTFCYFENKDYIRPYKLDSCWLKEGKNIGIAGDCVFNFNEKKVSYFWKKIKKDNNEENQQKNQQIKEILLLCSSMHHSPFNFSLMPTTGGLNNIKGNGLDRIDVFLNTLKNIYDDLKELDESGIKKSDIKELENYIHIQKQGKIGEIDVSTKPRKALIHFLWCVGSFKNYCKIFYQLDYEENEDNLVNKLIKNAEKNESIENSDQLVEYMKLAVEYWKKQKEKYDENEKKYNENKEKYEENKKKILGIN